MSLTNTTDFRISGMTCQGCARKVAAAIKSVEGVDFADVNLAESQASVRWTAGMEPAPAAIEAAVKAAGFKAKHIDPHGAEMQASGWSPLDGWKFNVFFGGAALLVLMVGEWVFNLGMERWYQWAAFAVATPLQFICGARFYRGAWMQLQRGESNMDTLVALGSTTAYAFSTWGLFTGWHGHLYFMESLGIITLISVGHWLESLASSRAADSLKALMHLAPRTARKLTGGVEEEAPVAELRANDLLVLKPGDGVPADGEVVDGTCTMDESMLTGESIPVEKREGSKLYGGTVNTDGRLVMRVTATGEATALAQIIAVVQRAQGSRASIQKLGDQVSSVFVPVVVLIALGTALWWGLAYDSALAASHAVSAWLWPGLIPQTALAAAFIQAAAVLIVACPCAMGLATPAAIMAGTNAAARRGILIRDGEALEKSGTITAVLFDKTGTLTEGKLTVAAVAVEEGVIEADAKGFAVAMAEPSNHPLSRAVVTVASSNSLRPPLQDWRELRGQGLEAQCNGETVRLGSLRWLAECDVKTPSSNAFVEAWVQRGATVLGLSRGLHLLGMIALKDQLKTDAPNVIDRLNQGGQKVFLVTGDLRPTAEAIASQAGIPKEHVFAEVRPEAKAGIVQQLQSRGERVAFVGDGINDAPALEQADLGIAVAKASDVAREAADIILLKSEISAVPEALGLARATLRTIKQNLFWAFFYNAAAIPLAVVGLMSPLLCAAAMGLSDLIVIGNALRLRRWKG